MNNLGKPKEGPQPMKRKLGCYLHFQLTNWDSNKITKVSTRTNKLIYAKEK